MVEPSILRISPRYWKWRSLPMSHVRILTAVTIGAIAAVAAAQGARVLTGRAALGGWRADAPGVRRHLEVKDMAAPAMESAVANRAAVAPRPEGAMPKAPAGFK